MANCRGCGCPDTERTLDVGWCSHCTAAVQMEVTSIERVLNDSYRILRESKNPDTKLSRCNLIERHLTRLVEIAAAGFSYSGSDPAALLAELSQRRADFEAEALQRPLKRSTATALRPQGPGFYAAQDIDVGSQPDTDVGLLHGRHYTESIERVMALKRSGMLNEARLLLTEMVAACEEEAAAMTARRGPWKLAPWYYEQLAIVNRKLKLHDEECAVLERYLGSRGAIPERRPDFEARLARARKLARRPLDSPSPAATPPRPPRST
ncbi:MAG: hypothetical protein ACT4PU_07220 [Planctomycetota bacterium]